MRILAIGLIILLASGCSLLTPETINDVRVVNKEPYHPTRSNPVYLQLPTIDLITPLNIDKEINRLKESGGEDFVYVVYDWEEYLELSKAVDSLLNKIKQQNILICHYRTKLKEPICEGIPKQEPKHEEKKDD